MMASQDQLRGALAERRTGGDVEPAAREMTIGQIIDRQRAEIARALPAHMDADRLARLATTVIKTNPTLSGCTASSLLGSLMFCAQMGLEPGPLGHCWLVPRRNDGVWEAQWELGYTGVIELARRTGELKSIEAWAVRENDDYEFVRGLEEVVYHKQTIEGDPGDIVAFWGIARFHSGGHYWVVAPKARIDAIRARSQSGSRGKGPWETDYEAMGQKSIVKMMRNWLPQSPQLAAALAHDGAVHRDFSKDMIDQEPAFIDVAAHEHDVDPDEETVPDPGTASEPVDVPTGGVTPPEPRKGPATEARAKLKDPPPESP